VTRVTNTSQYHLCLCMYCELVYTFLIMINTEIFAYNNLQTNNDRLICELLCQQISQSIPDAENKIWHGAPVWFIDGNPVVGYSKLKSCVQLLFWSGQSFDEPALSPNGSFKAAEVRYTNTDQINIDDLQRWLAKSQTTQWDYKNIVKRRGVLERLK
jgi:hypothetical protein